VGAISGTAGRAVGMSDYAATGVDVPNGAR
jgi:hypothetical protein